MTLEETIFTILVQDKLSNSSAGVFDTFFERDGNQYKFKEHDLIAIALDMANEFKKANKEDLLTE